MAKSSTENQFKKRLAAANKNWASAKTKASESAGGVEFEDGRYLARLVAAKLGESAGGRLQVRFDFKFEQDDEHAYGGKVKYDYQGVETEQNLEFFARRLEQLGYEAPDDLSQIVDILLDIEKEKPLCKIRLKSKGDFQNVYIDKVYGNDEESDEDEGEESDGGDVEDAAEEEEAEEAPAPKKGKKTKKEEPPAEEEEEEETEEDEDEEEAEEEEAEEEDGDDEESDQVELTVGMTVVAETSKGTVTGTVIEILVDENKVRVKGEDGKVVRVALEKIAIPEEVPEEPVKSKAKKGKK